MTKRLQIVLRDTEYREIQRAARARRITAAEWVRLALELALLREPLSLVAKKLEAARAAAQHSFPSGDIESILSEIGGHDSQSES